tara:strand:+ start:10506 stop:11150 length:645 start_codon:yes stop_codon:yes gene_type:complete
MNMKTYMTGLAAATALTAFAAPALAAVNISGSVTGVSANSGSGLIINAAGLGPFSGSLTNVGDVFSANILTVGTPEGAVDLDDFASLPISVTFGFTSPTGTSPNMLTGTSTGFYNLNPFSSCFVLGGNGGCGSVVWGAPTVFSFGTTGQFSLNLSDVSFNTPGSAIVKGKFKLLALDTPPIPEPSTWAMLLLGFGATGYAMRRRQRQSVQYKFA